MANVATPLRLSGLAKRLVGDGLLNEEQALAAQDAAKEAQLPFVSYLVNHKILASADIAAIASEEFGVPLFDITSMNLDGSATGLIQEKLIRQHNALPLYQRGKRLYVAVSDPTNLQALDEFQFNTGLNTYPVLVDEQKLSTTIEKALASNEQQLDGFDDEDLDDIDLGPDELEQKEDSVDTNVDDTPVVRFINGILANAIKSGASDIHFEPYEKRYRVRMRVDGILHEMKGAPIALGGRIAARLKVLSRLNIAERRVPQDGRMRLKLSKSKAIDFRVNTCPTLFGEKNCITYP
jgi:type IV pilus assembly protein PilB